MIGFVGTLIVSIANASLFSPPVVETKPSAEDISREIGTHKEACDCMFFDEAAYRSRRQEGVPAEEVYFPGCSIYDIR